GSTSAALGPTSAAGSRTPALAADMPDVVDWTDPCARAAALREAYFDLLAGRSAAVIRYRQLEHEREVRYRPIDRSVLLLELKAAENQCSGCRGIHTLKLSSTKGL